MLKYVAQMTAELREMAKTSRHGRMVAHLLDVARLAADQELRDLPH